MAARRGVTARGARKLSHGTSSRPAQAAADGVRASDYRARRIATYLESDLEAILTTTPFDIQRHT